MNERESCSLIHRFESERHERVDSASTHVYASLLEGSTTLTSQRTVPVETRRGLGSHLEAMADDRLEIVRHEPIGDGRTIRQCPPYACRRIGVDLDEPKVGTHGVFFKCLCRPAGRRSRKSGSARANRPPCSAASDRGCSTARAPHVARRRDRALRNTLRCCEIAGRLMSNSSASAPTVSSSSFDRTSSEPAVFIGIARRRSPRSTAAPFKRRLAGEAGIVAVRRRVERAGIDPIAVRDNDQRNTDKGNGNGVHHVSSMPGGGRKFS